MKFFSEETDYFLINTMKYHPNWYTSIKEGKMPLEIAFKKGEIIYSEGEFEMSMFRIIRGSVSIVANYGSDREMFLTSEREGEYFGHYELIEAIPRTATVLADSDVVLLKIMGDEFGSYFAEHNEDVMKILIQMSGRLREVGNSLHDIYSTIDRYLSEDKPTADKSFISKWAKILRIGKTIR